jgi:glyoxylase-like metal-dependent hydrolase (beta-lactamase superfamily II)
VLTVQAIPLAYNTVYLVHTDGNRVLIDTGPDYLGATEVLGSALAGETPHLVIATHAHSDHAGLARWWQGRGVRVGIGADDARLVRAPHFSEPGEFDAFANYVAAAGAPSGLQPDLIRGLEGRRQTVRHAATADRHPAGRPTDRWPTGLRFLPFDPGQLLDDGAAIAPRLRVIACPGHTPGNLVVVAEGDGLLFSGDQLLPDITPTPGVQFVPSGDGWARFPSLPQFVASLERLRRLDLTRCYPGHGQPFDDVATVIDQNLAQVEQRTERVLTELRDAGEARVHALAERLYPRALQRRWWQIVATIQGHLDLLAERGEARCDEEVWRAVR